MPAALPRGRKRPREEHESDNARAKVSKKGKTWYSQRRSFWNQQEPSTASMTGRQINCEDVAFSLKFVDFLKKSSAVGKKCAFRIALDVGAGIGRVSSQVLVRKVKERVDLVDFARRLLQKARTTLKGKRQASSFFCSGLQDFVPAQGRYDLVWCQGVFQYVTDADMVRFLRRARAGLQENGLVVVKEFLPAVFGVPVRVGIFQDTEGHNFHVRNPKGNEDLYSKAGFRVVVKRLQWVSNEAVMVMYALAPADL